MFFDLGFLFLKKVEVDNLRRIDTEKFVQFAQALKKKRGRKVVNIVRVARPGSVVAAGAAPQPVVAAGAAPEA